MKKFIAAILLLILLLSGCVATGLGETTTAPTPTNSETATEKNNYKNNEITLTEKYLAEIDKEYKIRLENDELSNYEIGEVSQEYAKKWCLIADDYYNKILEKPDEYLYDKGLLKSSIIKMKENWDNYSKQEKNDYNNLLIAIHGGGTIVGPETAKYDYELEKQWALKILEIAERMNME